MNSEIKKQLFRMHFVLGVLTLLGLWQVTFVLTAISANIFLNMTIFGTFAFGVFVAYRNVFALGNEFVAYNSLREDYEDAVNSEAQDAADPNWRFYRCKDDAIIFVKPQVIEQAYQIISEEIARTSNLSMTIGGMQNVLDSIDLRLDERKSLVQYITGILVFLGLIGTFVGLMATLGSVGNIIGNLDLSGSAGADAIAGLMKDLQIPLQGMATGFSSSLFGLITSLALGLMARFATQAAGVLRSEIETWLAQLTKVDGTSEATSSGGSLAFQERQLSLIYRAARLSMVSNSRVVTTVEKMAETTDKMVAAHIDTQRSNQTIATSVNALAENQSTASKALMKMTGVLETRADLEDLISELKKDSEVQAQAFGQITSEIGVLASHQEELQRHARENLAHYVQRDELAWLLNNAQEKVTEEFNRVHGSVDSIGKLLAEIDSTLDENTRTARMSQLELAEKSRELRDDLANAIAESREAIKRADEAVEQEIDKSTRDLHGTRIYSPYQPPLEQSQSNLAGTSEKKRRKFRFFG